MFGGVISYLGEPIIIRKVSNEVFDDVYGATEESYIDIETYAIFDTVTAAQLKDANILITGEEIRAYVASSEDVKPGDIIIRKNTGDEFIVKNVMVYYSGVTPLQKTLYLIKRQE